MEQERILKELDFDKNEISQYNKRDCYNFLAEYIRSTNGNEGRVICLHGLRRTGKTTLMKQLSLEFGGKIYQVQNGQTMEHVFETLDYEKSNGAKIVFIDEITYAKDFIINSALLADLYCSNGLKVVVAGTDSLGLVFAKNSQLYDRTFDVDTTYISFSEHARVLQTDEFDKYIKHGGLMCVGIDEKLNNRSLPNKGINSFEDAKTFLDSAVAENIVNSLKKASSISNYMEIQNHTMDDVKKCVVKMVELYNGVFTHFMLNNSIVPSYGETFMNINRNSKIDNVLKNEFTKIDRNQMMNDYMTAINISEDLDEPVTLKFVKQLDTALSSIDLLSANITHKYTKMPGADSKEIPWDKDESYEYYIMVPAVKYWLLMETKKQFLKNADIKFIDIEAKALFEEKLEEDIFGHITEATVFFQTKKTVGLENYDIIKPYFYEGKNSLGEYDMLVYDKIKSKHWAFEIKHAKKIYDKEEALKEGVIGGQDKHLLNKSFSEEIKRRYGERQANIVLYNGMLAKTKNNVLYINVGEFLMNLDKTKDMEKTIGHFENLLRRGKEPPSPPGGSGSGNPEIDPDDLFDGYMDEDADQASYFSFA